MSAKWSDSVGDFIWKSSPAQTRLRHLAVVEACLAGPAWRASAELALEDLEVWAVVEARLEGALARER